MNKSYIKGRVRVDSKEGMSVFLKYLNTIFDRYMRKFPHKEQLEIFMEDEKKLYNDDGSLTEEYKQWILKVEKYCRENPMEIDADNKILQGAKDYFVKQKELRASYNEAENKDEWMDKMLDSEKKKKVFDSLIDNEIQTLGNMIDNKVSNLNQMDVKACSDELVDNPENK